MTKKNGNGKGNGKNQVIGLAGGGSKAFNLDYDAIGLLATVGCTDEEIENLLDLSTGYLAHRKKRDKKLVTALKKGLAQMKKSLRRAQFQKAMEGNPTMLIWLGKQFLNQKDRHEFTIEDYQREVIRIAQRAGVDADELERKAGELAGTLH